MVDVYLDVTCDNCGHGQDISGTVADHVAPILAALIDWHVANLPTGRTLPDDAVRAGRWDTLLAATELITGFGHGAATAWLIGQCTARAGVAISRQKGK